MTEQQVAELLALLNQIAQDLAAIRAVQEKSFDSDRPFMVEVPA